MRERVCVKRRLEGTLGMMGGETAGEHGRESEEEDEGGEQYCPGRERGEAPRVEVRMRTPRVETRQGDAVRRCARVVRCGPAKSASLVGRSRHVRRASSG